MQGGSRIQKTVISTQHNPAQPTDITPTNAPLGSLTIALSVGVVCAIVGYRKHRATVLRRQIECLNRIWQLDSRKKLF